MEWAEHAIQVVQTVGFPTAVAGFLLWGLHYWTRRLYQDIVIPIKDEVIVSIRASAAHRTNMLTETKRGVDAVERLVVSVARLANGGK